MADPALNLSLHKRQGDVLLTAANEILYGGAAGGGKSHLMRVMAILMCCAVPHLQVYIFRKHYGDLYKNHIEGPSGFVAMLNPLGRWVSFKQSKNEFVFRNRAKIHLCHLQYKKDLMKYHGAEIHLLLMDEATHFTEEEYRFLRNRVRLGGLSVADVLIDSLALELPAILCGTNPGSIGHNWVKRTFVDNGPMRVVETPKTEGGMRRVYIPAKIEDNPTLLANDPGYLDRLEGLGNPELVKAMRHGDWNIVAGGALDDVWSEENIVPRFRIPAGWRVDRSFDWGSSHPFSVGWWAESNGETVEVEFRGMTEEDSYTELWEFPAGSLIRIYEWYGTKDIGSNQGVKMAAPDIAIGILEREEELRRDGWIAGEVKPGPADGQIYQVAQQDVPTIADKMAAFGVKWERADKSPGSRVNGLELLRSRLTATEDPGIYFMQHCRAAISTLPVLPRCQRNPEDVDTAAEDHVYDEVRYRVLASASKELANIKVAYYGTG